MNKSRNVDDTKLETKPDKATMQKCTLWLEPPRRTADQALDRMMFELIPRLQDRRVHLLHGVAQLDTKSAQNVSLPRVVLGVHPCLHLFVVDDANAETALRLRGVERRSCFLDFGEELLPMCKRVSESVEDVFSFKVPE